MEMVSGAHASQQMHNGGSSSRAVALTGAKCSCKTVHSTHIAIIRGITPECHRLFERGSDTVRLVSHVHSVAKQRPPGSRALVCIVVGRWDFNGRCKARKSISCIMWTRSRVGTRKSQPSCPLPILGPTAKLTADRAEL